MPLVKQFVIPRKELAYYKQYYNELYRWPYNEISAEKRYTYTTTKSKTKPKTIIFSIWENMDAPKRKRFIPLELNTIPPFEVVQRWANANR